MTDPSPSSAAIEKLMAVVAQLRNPEGGCPWDLAQTHQSLLPYVLEEAHEVADALRSGDDTELSDELGDLLLQVVLHAQIAAERQAFDLAQIAEGISAKLVRRHPHVFGEGAELESADEVLARWDEIKAAEKVAKGLPINKRKIFRDLPPRLPALLFALDVFKRADKAGLADTTSCNEPGENSSEGESDETKMGHKLFLLVSECRKAGVDPESALRRYTSEIVEELEPQASL